MLKDWNTLHKLILGVKKTVGHGFITKRALITALLKSGIPERFWLSVLLLGVVIGFGIKWVAQDTFTLGFEDYRVKRTRIMLDLNASQKRALNAGANLTEPKQRDTYPNCSLEE